MSMTLAPERATNRKQRRAATAQRRRRDDAPPPLPNALAYRVDDACRLAGFGRTFCYRLVQEGKLKLIHVNGRSFIVGDSLRRLLSAEPAEAPAEADRAEQPAPRSARRPAPAEAPRGITA
jgi:hypothetical protein